MGSSLAAGPPLVSGWGDETAGSTRGHALPVAGSCGHSRGRRRAVRASSDQMRISVVYVFFNCLPAGIRSVHTRMHSGESPVLSPSPLALPCSFQRPWHSLALSSAHDSPRPATMPLASALPSPLTTKPRSAFMRLRVVTPPPQAPPSSASDWTALLAAALPNTYGDADGSRFAFSVLSAAPEERPGEAVAVVQVRAGEERRVWAALTLATHWAGRPVRVDVVGVAAWGMGSGVLGRRIGWAPPPTAEGTPGVGVAMDVGGV